MQRKEEDKSLEQRPKLSSQGYGAGAATDHLWREGLRVRHLVGNMENNSETVETNNPYHPCMVYLSTFTKKNQPNVGVYIYIPYMDPMG